MLFPFTVIALLLAIMAAATTEPEIDCGACCLHCPWWPCPRPDSGCGSQCTTYSTITPAATSTESLTVSTPTITSLQGDSALCIISPTVSGFPTTSACIGVNDVTFFLSGKFVGPTPVCTSQGPLPPNALTSTTIVPGVSEIFNATLMGPVGSDGIATATDTFSCFTAMSPTCPFGFVPQGTPTGASFTNAVVDAMATGNEQFIFRASHTTSTSCPRPPSVTPVDNFRTVSETILCATPSASGFPTCPLITVGLATFTVSATYTADSITCVSTAVAAEAVVIMATEIQLGIPGTTTYITQVVTTTATDGRSASVSPQICVTASVIPTGVCSQPDFTSSTYLGTGSFLSADLSVTATGTLTQTNAGANSRTCTLSPTAYSVGSGAIPP
ncbi:hypothetical protein V1527DRAFT_478940 [Lipomyces starkeyi]